MKIKFDIRYNYRSNNWDNGSYRSEGTYDSLEAAREALFSARPGGEPGTPMTPYRREIVERNLWGGKLVTESYSNARHDDHCEIVAWVSSAWSRKHEDEAKALATRLLGDMGGELK